MNPVLNTTNVAQPGNQSRPYQLTAPAIETRTEPTEQVRRDLQERATQVGPLLEEMLRSHSEHWQHWGLND